MQLGTLTVSSMKTDVKLQEHLYNGNYAVKYLLIGSQMKAPQSSWESGTEKFILVQ